jgi:hypothetical protein
LLFLIQGDFQMKTTPAMSFGLLAVCLGATLLASETSAQTQGDKYAGDWNYDQPSASTGANVGTIQCPARSKTDHEFVMVVPQIGNLTLTRKEAGRLEGRTDQGCTWTFKDNGSSGELDPAPQSCFNKVIGSSYTITHWSLRVEGNHETESLEAKSHQPMGDCDFALKQGSRTKADDTDSTGLFVGDWVYDAPDPRTHSNILQFMYQGQSQHSGPGASPQTGLVTFSKSGGHTLTALTADGCSWRLDVYGNTALLPSPQTCELTGSKITMNHWTIASNGEQQNAVMNMTQDEGGKIRTVLLATGNLSKQQSR